MAEEKGNAQPLAALVARAQRLRARSHRGVIQPKGKGPQSGRHPPSGPGPDVSPRVARRRFASCIM